MLVGAAVKLNIFIELAAKPRSANSLADDMKLSNRTMPVFLTALAEAGYLTLENNVYRLTQPALEKFGDKQGAAYLGWAVLHSWRLAQRWLTLPEVLAGGEAVPGNRFSESVEGFVRAMDVYAGPTAKQVADICLTLAPKAMSILDVGGATGTASKVFIDYGLKATLFDIPDVIETIKDEISASFPQITPVGGDFNKLLPAGPFDIVFMGNITHIYGPAKNAALFKRANSALSPSGLIAIQDYVRGISPSAPLFGINMLVNTERGGTWTLVQYTDWLTDAGFTDVEYVDLAARDQQLVLAKKK